MWKTKGVGMPFKNREEAEAFLDMECHPTPRRNLLERQAQRGSQTPHYPGPASEPSGSRSKRADTNKASATRPLDHAEDLAKAAALKTSSEVQKSIRTLIIDFEHVFMSIPLRVGERAFNC